MTTSRSHEFQGLKDTAFCQPKDLVRRNYEPQDPTVETQMPITMSIGFTAYGLRTAAYVHMGLHMVCGTVRTGCISRRCRLRIPVPGTSFSARTISTSSSHLQMSAYMRIRVCSARADVICSARGAAGRPLRAPAANNVPRKDNRERCDDDRKLEIAGKPLDGTG